LTAGLLMKKHDGLSNMPQLSRCLFCCRKGYTGGTSVCESLKSPNRETECFFLWYVLEKAKSTCSMESGDLLLLTALLVCMKNVSMSQAPHFCGWLIA